jgi:uncharacterized membrane protein
MSIFCPKCGASLPDESKYCFKCGAPIPVNVNTDTPIPKTIEAPVTPDSMNLARLLCYVAGILSGIIFLNLEPYRADRDIRFHAWQSIFFTLTWLGVLFIYRILPFIFFPLFPLAFLLQLAFFGLWVVLLAKAYNGEKFKLPILGDMAEARSKT